MSTATVQQIGQNLAAWLAVVQRGETVAIVDAGHVVAQLSPPDKESAAWPDFAARRRAIFGDVMLPAGTVAALVNEDRGA